MSKAEGDDVAELVDNDELAQDIQPHVRQSREVDDNVARPEQVNPAFEEKEERNDSGNASGRNIVSGISNEQNGNAQNVYDGNAGTITTLPVYYNSQTGDANVVHEPVVIRQPNGVRVIRTRECCHVPNNYRRRERPLKLNHIKFLKVLSIIAVVIFFPLGIPAMYYAFKSEKEFHAGIMRGDLDLARKWARRSERLLIFSVMGALLVAVAVFAIVERKLMANDEEYWKNRSNNLVLPSG